MSHQRKQTILHSSDVGLLDLPVSRDGANGLPHGLEVAGAGEFGPLFGIHRSAVGDNIHGETV